MRILHLSDFNCPYSYIGLNRISKAIKELNLDVEWEMRAFELEPNAKSIKVAESIAAKNSMSIEEAEREIENIERIAEDDGLTINCRNMLMNSSKDAHRLVKYVQEKHPEASQKLILKIFEANFIENEDISDTDILLKISASCNLNQDEINEFLERDSLRIEVDLDMDEALSNGITTIPYYFIEHNDERLIVPGVFDEESFKTAFEDLLSGKMKSKTFI